MRGLLLYLDGLGDSTGVRDDYVMAGVSILLTSMYRSLCTGQLRGLASCVRLSTLCSGKKIPRG